MEGLDDLRTRIRGLEALCELGAGRIAELELRVDRISTRLLVVELHPQKG